jgi:hypothetical protein
VLSSPKAPLATQRFRLGVFSAAANAIIVTQEFQAGSSVTIGRASESVVQLPEYDADCFELITAGVVLHMEPGMRLNMCGDGGADHVQGTFEELCACGVGPDVVLNVPRVNLTLRPGLSVFIKALPDTSPS